MKSNTPLRHALSTTTLIGAALIGMLFAAPSALAAPPTEAQVDKLIETMDLRRRMDDVLLQIDAMSESMDQRFLGEDATPEQRKMLSDTIAKQQVSMRKTLSWEAMAPVYRRIYTRLFSAEEIEAMTAFYGSDIGRGIMVKIPQSMQLVMEEMLSIMEPMIADMEEALKTELKDADESASVDAAAP